MAAIEMKGSAKVEPDAQEPATEPKGGKVSEPGQEGPPPQHRPHRQQPPAPRTSPPPPPPRPRPLPAQVPLSGLFRFATPFDWLCTFVACICAALVGVSQCYLIVIWGDAMDVSAMTKADMKQVG